MRTFFFAAAIAIISLLASSPASFAQTDDPNIAAKHAIGEIKSIDTAAKQLTIKTDAGSVLTVTLSDKTTYKKLAPGEKSLTNATDLTFADLGEGDRVMARGTVSDDRRTTARHAALPTESQRGPSPGRGQCRGLSTVPVAVQGQGWHLEPGGGGGGAAARLRKPE